MGFFLRAYEIDRANDRYQDARMLATNVGFCRSDKWR